MSAVQLYSTETFKDYGYKEVDQTQYELKCRGKYKYVGCKTCGRPVVVSDTPIIVRKNMYGYFPVKVHQLPHIKTYFCFTCPYCETFYTTTKEVKGTTAKEAPELWVELFGED